MFKIKIVNNSDYTAVVTAENVYKIVPKEKIKIEYDCSVLKIHFMINDNKKIHPAVYMPMVSFCYFLCFISGLKELFTKKK